jgi:hypothetical protein
VIAVVRSSPQLFSEHFAQCAEQIPCGGAQAGNVATIIISELKCSTTIIGGEIYW